MRFALVTAAVTLAAVAFGAFALTSSGPAAADDQTVAADNFYFCDSSQSGSVCQTSITTGDTVTWSVTGGSHTVTQCSGSDFATCPSSGGFDSSQLSSGGTFQQTFDSAGTFYYRCNFHPAEMRGQITVAEAQTATPTQAPTDAPTDGGSPTASPAGIPQTGGFPDDSGSGTMFWVYAFLALGMLFAAGGVASYAIARARD